MSKKGKLLAISYFMVHFFVEIICFTLITQFMSFKDAVLLSLVFDFFAFVPQIFFGIINTKFKTLDLHLSSRDRISYSYNFQLLSSILNR